MAQAGIPVVSPQETRQYDLEKLSLEELETLHALIRKAEPD